MSTKSPHPLILPSINFDVHKKDLHQKIYSRSYGLSTVKNKLIELSLNFLANFSAHKLIQ